MKTYESISWKEEEKENKKRRSLPSPVYLLVYFILSCFGYILVSGVDQIMSRNLADCLW